MSVWDARRPHASGVETSWAIRLVRRPRPSAWSVNARIKVVTG